MTLRHPAPRFLLLALAGAVLCCAVPSAHAFGFSVRHEKKHEYKHEIEALEEQWRTAQLAGDVPMLDRMLSDDYVGISMTGQVNTKAQQLSRVRNRTLVLTRIDIVDSKIKLIGQVAIVTVQASVEGTSDGRVMNGSFRYTRIYQHVPTGGWKITNFEATRIPNLHGTAGNSNPSSHPEPSAVAQEASPRKRS